LGVTRYFEEYGFDKDTGKLRIVGKRDKDGDKDGDKGKVEGGLTQEQEQAMIKDFASYHQLEYRLMMVSKETWPKIAAAYGTKGIGIPIVVLIDREGIVRMVKAGPRPENTEAVRAQIKKLVAERSR